MVSSVDVAKLAGVSQATVSRVLNNSDKVNAETVEKVNAAIKELNYRPNAAARSLISRKSGIIALLCGPLQDPENAEFADRAISYVQDNGFIAEVHIQLANNPGTVFEAVGKTQAEGMIIGPLIAGNSEMKLLENAGIPFVLCGTDNQNNGDFITLDNRAAGKMAADHISLLEHEVVGWLGGNMSDRRLQERYDAFSASMKEKNIKVISAAGTGGDYDEIFTAMMARKNRPTAIIAATDEIGAYALDFLSDFGYSIPDDIAVLGFGNYKQSSKSYLRLTSIGLPAERDICREAMDRLFRLIDGEPQEKELATIIKPVLFKRSTA